MRRILRRVADECAGLWGILRGVRILPRPGGGLPGGQSLPSAEAIRDEASMAALDEGAVCRAVTYRTEAEAAVLFVACPSPPGRC